MGKWLFDGVAKAEGVNTDNENFKFNVGGVLYADWMADYGVLKNDANPIIAEDGKPYARPVFTSEEQSVQVTNKIQKDHWQNALKSDDPFLEFAKSYTHGYNADISKMDEDSLLRLNNYADVIADHYRYGEQVKMLDQSIGNVNNITELQQYEKHIRANYPQQQSLIDEMLKSGSSNMDEVYSRLHEDQEKDIKNPTEEGAFRTAVDNFQAGMYFMVKDIGGAVNLADQKFGSDDDGENSVGNWMKGVGERGLEYNQYEQKENFEFEDVMSQEFWTTNVAQTIPAMLSFLIPGTLGVKGTSALLKGTAYFRNLQKFEQAFNGTAKGLKTLKKMNMVERVAVGVGGATSGRIVESLIESGGNFENMRDLGYTDEQSGRSAQQVFMSNMKLIATDVPQIMSVMTKLPVGLLPSFGKWAQRGINVSKFGVSSGVEGLEEVAQNYFQHMGEASINNEIEDKGFWDAMTNMDSESKKAFAVGTLMGGIQQGGFSLGQTLLNPDALTNEQVDEINNNEYVRFVDRKEAKEQSTQKFEGKLGDWLTKVSGLNALKDKLTISFVDKTIRDVYTEAELKIMGYSDPESSKATIRIKEDNPRYNKKVGGKQYIAEPSGISETKDGQSNILFGLSADNHTAIEEVTEVIHDRIKETDPDLYNEIEAWKQSNQGKTNYQGRELFSKTFSFLYADIKEGGESAFEKSELIKGGVEVDAQLFDRVASLFELDGVNLIDEITDSRPEYDGVSGKIDEMLADTQDIEVINYDADTLNDQQIASTEEGLNEASVLQDVAQLNNDNAPGSVKDLLDQKQQVNKLEEILFGDEYLDPIIYESNLPDEVDWAYVPHSKKKEIAKIQLNEEQKKLLKKEKRKEDDLEILRQKNRAKRKEPMFNESLSTEARSRAYTKKQIETKLEEIQVDVLQQEGGQKFIDDNFGSLKSHKRLNKMQQIDQILALQEFLNPKSEQGQLDMFEGARFNIPSSLFEKVTWDQNKKKIMRSILGKYGDLKTNGSLRIYVPNDLTDTKLKNLHKLMTGWTKQAKDEDGKAKFKTNKKGEFVLTERPDNYKGKKPFKPKKIPINVFTKNSSGLFKSDNIIDNIDADGKRYIEYTQKKGIAPPVASWIAYDRDAEQKGFRTKFDEKNQKEAYRAMTREEYYEALERAVEIGAIELTEQSDDIFNTLLDLEYDKDNRPDFADISLGWYTESVQEAIKVLKRSELPSLKEKKNELLYRALLGFTSPDNAVDFNENLAIEIYKSIESHGSPKFTYKSETSSFFEDSEGNQVGVPQSITSNINAFFKMKDELGSFENAIAWMKKKHPLEKLQSMAEKIGKVSIDKKTGEFKKIDKMQVKAWSYGEFDSKIYGTEIFGFKVGTFTGNLLGISDVGTMDLWMSRQMSRWLGAPFKQGTENALNLFAERDFAVNDAKTESYTQPGQRQNFHLMRQAVAGIAKDQRVIDKFGKLEPMQVQAILWYMEKALFRVMNVRGQKPLGEADYGNWAKEREQKRLRDSTYTGFESAEKIKAKRRKDKGVRGSSKRSLKDIVAEGVEGARFGRITLNSTGDNNTTSDVYFNHQPSDEEKKRTKLHKKLYDPKQKRDLINTFSSQVKRIHPKLPAIFRKYDFDAQELLKKHMTNFEPLILKMEKMFKHAQKSGDAQLQADHYDLEFHLSNGNMKEANPLIDKYNLRDEIAQVRDSLDELQEQARAVGYDFGFINNYFPRVVKDHVNLLANIKSRIEPEQWRIINEEIDITERETNTSLADEQKLQVAERVLMTQAGAFGAKPDNLKVRKILELDRPAFQYYERMHEALKIYAFRMSEAITQRKAFGVGRYTIRNNKLKSDLYILEKDGKFAVYKEMINKEGKLVDEQFTKPFDTFTEAKEYTDIHQRRQFVIHDKATGKNLQDRFVNKVDAKSHLRKMNKEEYDRSLIPSTGTDEQIEGFLTDAIVNLDIDKRYEARLRDLTKTYLNSDPANGFYSGIKKVGYAITLGSPLSAITQIGDLGMSTWMAGDVGYLSRPITGVARTLKAFTESLLSGGKGWSKNFITLQDMNIDVIAEELRPEASQPKMDWVLKHIFSLSGFRAMDRIGKETTINAIASKTRNALMQGKGQTFEEVSFKLRQSFTNSEIQEITNDMVNKNFKSDIVRQWAFCEIAGVQPISKSEMPVSYLRNAKMGRLGYQLKTFAIKRFDVYKDEIQFIAEKRNQALKDGNKSKARMLELAGGQRIAIMAMMFVSAEMGAEAIKDFIRGTGEDKDFLSDRVAGNLLKQVFLSKYAFWKMKQDGILNTFYNALIPPVANATDELLRDDVQGMYKAYEKRGKHGLEKYIRDKRLKMYRYVPLVGKNLYHWNDELLPIPKERDVAKYGIGRGNVADRRYQRKKSKGQ